jgi:hypothetical protein
MESDPHGSGFKKPVRYRHYINSIFIRIIDIGEMKIGIIGTRGIPNNYGGFEQCAEYLSLGLVGKGHDVTVYSSHKHSYSDTLWKNVHIIHRFDPEYKLGTLGQFIYDLNCILDTRKKKYDIILQLGYTSSSIWGWLLPGSSIITTNMDGLEWKRTKFSKPVQLFLRFAEYLGVFFSDHLISDSLGIQQYILNKYKKDSVFIPYGAFPMKSPDQNILKEFSVEPYRYFILIARIEPENSLEIIIDGIIKSGTKIPILIIGNPSNKYGKYLVTKYKKWPGIKFQGSIYDINKLNNLRHYSTMYFHGHTVGGTNPSLLEAMASESLICANDNVFNRHILDEDAYYFRTSGDISKLLNDISFGTDHHQNMVERNIVKIKEKYNWEEIVNLYEDHFIDILNRKIPKIENA